MAASVADGGTDDAFFRFGILHETIVAVRQGETQDILVTEGPSQRQAVSILWFQHRITRAVGVVVDATLERVEVGYVGAEYASVIDKR